MVELKSQVIIGDRELIEKHFEKVAAAFVEQYPEIEVNKEFSHVSGLTYAPGHSLVRYLCGTADNILAVLENKTRQSELQAVEDTILQIKKLLVEKGNTPQNVKKACEEIGLEINDEGIQYVIRALQGEIVDEIVTTSPGLYLIGEDVMSEIAPSELDKFKRAVKIIERHGKEFGIFVYIARNRRDLLIFPGTPTTVLRKYWIVTPESSKVFETYRTPEFAIAYFEALYKRLNPRILFESQDGRLEQAPDELAMKIESAIA